MVRLARQEELTDLQNLLKTDFAAADLRGRFLAELPSAQRGQAQGLLKAFAAATRQLGQHERAFNAEARSETGLLRHLRDPAHFSVLKDFHGLATELAVLGGDAGLALTRQAAAEIDKAALVPAASRKAGPEVATFSARPLYTKG